MCRALPFFVLFISPKGFLQSITWPHHQSDTPILFILVAILEKCKQTLINSMGVMPSYRKIVGFCRLKALSLVVLEHVALHTAMPRPYKCTLMGKWHKWPGMPGYIYYVVCSNICCQVLSTYCAIPVHVLGLKDNFIHWNSKFWQLGVCRELTVEDVNVKRLCNFPLMVF